MTAKKHDEGKPRMSLVSPKALVEVAKVMTFGEVKYGKLNYLEGDGLNPWRLVDAALRHLNQHSAGEHLDDETDLPHLAHAAASCLMALEIIIKRSKVGS